MRLEGYVTKVCVLGESLEFAVGEVEGSVYLFANGFESLCPACVDATFVSRRA